MDQLPLLASKLGAWPTTQACALTGNRTGDLSVAGDSFGASSHTPKGCWFSPWSGHILRLWVRSLVRAILGSNRLMLLCKKSINISSGED